MHLTWVKRVVHANQAHWVQPIRYFYDTCSPEVYFGTKQTMFPRNKNIPQFYRDIHNTWMEVFSIETNTSQQIQNEYIWNNRFILSKNKTLLWKKWYQNGILKIGNLLDESGNFLSHTAISEQFDIKCNFLDMLTIRQCIPRKWKNILAEDSRGVPLSSSIIIKINNREKQLYDIKCKDFYWKLVTRKYVQPTCIPKWSKDFPMLDDVSADKWESIFKMSFTATRETKLQTFQYKLIHRVIPCNDWLYTIRIKDSNKCIYCSTDTIDNLSHFFVYCKNVQQFWMNFICWWNRLSDVKIQPDLDNILKIIFFGLHIQHDSISVLNHCLIIAKFYIQRQRLFHDNNIDFHAFLVELKSKLAIEENICKKELKPEKFEKYNFIFSNI